MADKPAKRFRIGNVSATVWRNESTDKSFYTVNFQRSFKDGDEWKNTDGLNHGDLLNVAMLATRAESSI